MIGALFSIYRISPVSWSISGLEYPLVNETLFIVLVLVVGVPLAPELIPVMAFVPLKAV